MQEISENYLSRNSSTGPRLKNSDKPNNESRL